MSGPWRRRPTDDVVIDGVAEVLGILQRAHLVMDLRGYPPARHGGRVSYNRRLAMNDERHGTYNGYANWGCRCLRCKNAGHEYHKAKRSRAVTSTHGEPA